MRPSAPTPSGRRRLSNHRRPTPPAVGGLRPPLCAEGALLGAGGEPSPRHRSRDCPATAAPLRPPLAGSGPLRPVGLWGRAASPAPGHRAPLRPLCAAQFMGCGSGFAAPWKRRHCPATPFPLLPRPPPTPHPLIPFRLRIPAGGRGRRGHREGFFMSPCRPLRWTTAMPPYPPKPVRLRRRPQGLRARAPRTVRTLRGAGRPPRSRRRASARGLLPAACGQSRKRRQMPPARSGSLSATVAARAPNFNRT